MMQRIVNLDRSVLRAAARRPAFEHEWIEYEGMGATLTKQDTPHVADVRHVGLLARNYDHVIVGPGPV
jgi:hypothetical protein